MRSDRSATNHTRRQERGSRRDALPGRAIRRGADIVGAAVGLLASAPLLAACGLWIRMVDGGPVLYRQWRVGRGGWLFPIYKLRTMGRDAEAGGVRLARRGDPRILRGCAWMRKSHVDELPQFWNILLGQMSLVGPRPERPELLDRLLPALPALERRLAVAPGLTGLAQLRNGYANDLSGYRRKLAYDLQYLRARSVWGDLMLVLRTVPRIWDRAAC